MGLGKQFGAEETVAGWRAAAAVVQSGQHAKETAELSPSGPPELAAHRAVEQEVDGRIKEGQQIKDFPHTLGVAAGEELAAENAAQQGHYPLWNFRHQKENQNGDQHPGRPIRLVLVP